MDKKYPKPFIIMLCEQAKYQANHGEGKRHFGKRKETFAEYSSPNFLIILCQTDRAIGVGGIVQRLDGLNWH